MSFNLPHGRKVVLNKLQTGDAWEVGPSLKCNCCKNTSHTFSQPALTKLPHFAALISPYLFAKLLFAWGPRLLGASLLGGLTMRKCDKYTRCYSTGPETFTWQEEYDYLVKLWGDEKVTDAIALLESLNDTQLQLLYKCGRGGDEPICYLIHFYHCDDSITHLPRETT
jgi:hypothetical protein